MYDKFTAESELTANESYTIEDATPTDISDYYYNDSEDNTENSEETEVTTKKNISSLRSRSRPNFRKSASQAYKERLRKRVEKEKAKLQLAELASKKSYRSKKVSSLAKNDEETETEPPRFKTRSRSVARARSFETDEVFTEVASDEAQGRSFGSRNSRPVRQRPSFRRNRFDKNISSRKSSEPEPEEEDRSSGSSSGFKPRTSRFSTRNRFKSRNENRFESAKTEASTTSKPVHKKSFSKPKLSTFDSDEEDVTRNPVVIKKFNKFNRPDYRKTLLNKLFDKRPDIKSRLEDRKQREEEEETEEEKTTVKDSDIEEDGDLAFPDDHESSPSALVPSIVDDENILQNLDNEEIRLERLLTTLDVSTAYPKELTNEYLEVATIRSPYTFNIEDNEKSTRFITITKSITKSMDIAPTKSFTSSASSTLAVSEIKPSSSIPLFDTNSIPPPENILASTSTPYEAIIQGSSDIEFLSPVTLTSSLHHATPPLKTVTETLSTVETMIKKSILPVVFGEESSLYTLTQTYSVTRIVTAVKTVPPMELYEFNPQQNFADFDTLFEEAGSERRESLLPGELEFSDQDNFGLEGPSVIKVAPPSDFVKDLDLIGSKFDFVDQMEKHNNPDVVQLKGSTPNIDSSFGQNSPSFAPEVTPEQLLYLQFLSNPLAALGIGGLGAQVIFFCEIHPSMPSAS